MIDNAPKNKMVTTPTAKKEFHFAATAEHFAEVVQADTIAEAEQIYHSVKRLINPPATATPTSAPAADPEALKAN
jgi:hypothetical protein